jgi:tetratricopeptide (TPR) repeat protein
MAELAALGYIAGTEPTPQPASGAGPGGESKMTEPYNLAKIAHSRGDLAEAERLYKQSLEMEPGFVLAMVSLASVYQDEGNQVERLRWILRALQTGNPNVPPAALLDFVDAAEAAGRLDRVLPALDMIRKQWGQTSTFHAARGRALERLGRPDEAVAAYRVAIERDPADPVATEALLRLAAAGRPVDVDALLAGHLEAVRGDLKRLNELAVICLRNHRPALAERALETVLASDPTNFGVLSNLAVALQLQGKSDRAAEILERAVVQRPDDPSLQFNLGATLASLQRHEEALRHLERARQLGSSDPRIYTAISKVLVRMGRPDEARQMLEEGRRLHPDSAEIGELLGALEAGG